MNNFRCYWMINNFLGVEDAALSIHNHELYEQFDIYQGKLFNCHGHHRITASLGVKNKHGLLLSNRLIHYDLRDDPVFISKTQ